MSNPEGKHNGERNEREPLSEIRSKALHAGTRRVAGTNWFELDTVPKSRRDRRSLSTVARDRVVEMGIRHVFHATRAW
jgi:hypothetical protein